MGRWGGLPRTGWLLRTSTAALVLVALAETAVGQPIMRTCGDTNMDGARDNFDCSGVPNFLAQDPQAIRCSGNPCTASECCTVEPIVIEGVTPLPCALPGQPVLEGQEPCPMPEPEPEPQPEPEPPEPEPLPEQPEPGRSPSRSRCPSPPPPRNRNHRPSRSQSRILRASCARK